METAIQSQSETLEIKPLNVSDANAFKTKATVLLDQSQKIVIKNQVELETAAAVRVEIKEISKKLDATRKGITVHLDNAKKAVMDLFRPASEKLEAAEKNVNSAILNYTAEQERIRRENEEKLRRQAAVEEEKKRKALQERADKAEAKGKADKAAELRQQAEEVHVEAPVIASNVDKVEGLSFREDWKAKVISINAVPREYLVVDESRLNALARATKGSLVIPGVEFYSVKTPITTPR